ncbi:RPS19B [Symbiodinium sp. KB8]|nr:RPS19B [Symbiodinium sp. KB8]
MNYTDQVVYTLKDVAPADFINAFAKQLKEENKIKLPAWVDLVKTGTHKELAPYDADNWYYVRAASVARKIYLRKGVGIGSLCRGFGGSKAGAGRYHFCRASAGIVRHIVQQLENLGLVERVPMKGVEGEHAFAGRTVTSKGREKLDQIARSLSKQLEEEEED